MAIAKPKTHPYDRLCVCADCAEYRQRLRHAWMQDFINWANAPLLAGMRRVEHRVWDGSIDVAIDTWQRAGLKLPKKLTAPVVRLNARVA